MPMEDYLGIDASKAWPTRYYGNWFWEIALLSISAVIFGRFGGGHFAIDLPDGGPSSSAKVRILFGFCSIGVLGFAFLACVISMPVSWARRNRRNKERCKDWKSMFDFCRNLRALKFSHFSNEFKIVYMTPEYIESTGGISILRELDMAVGKCLVCLAGWWVLEWRDGLG